MEQSKQQRKSSQNATQGAKNVSALYQPGVDYDDALEAAALGVFLLEPQSFGKYVGWFKPECFYNAEHSIVYQAIDSLFGDGYPIDLLTVARRIFDQGITKLGHSNVPYFLAKLTLDVTSSAHMETWALMLRELAIQRTALTITNSGIDRSEDALGIAEMVQEKLKALTDIRVADDWEDGSKVAIRLLQHMEDMAKGGGNFITTSIPDLDAVNGGFRAGQMILVGARPGMGKSAFMGRQAVYAAMAGHTVGVISLEMDSKDVFARMVSFHKDIPFYQLDRNDFSSSAEQQAAYQAISDTAALPIHFSDNVAVTIKDIRAKAERLKRRHNIGILFIDYLQLIESDSSKNAIREQEVAKISRGCKKLARELEIPIVVLVQLNRQADNEEPQLKHLRESGSLEQDADAVLMLFRKVDSEDPTIKNDATLFVRKWRNGSELKIAMHFDGARMKFMPMVEKMLEDNPIANTNAMRTAGARNALPPNDDVPF